MSGEVPTFGSLFAGIGGFDLGLELAGWQCAWQVEADAACRSVLRRHFPGVPIYEDVREVGSDLEPVDLVCGGFPCQDVSVAGRRAGLAGARSGLWWEFHRVLAALAPRWVLVENVAGLLSSNGGRDMGAILGGLAELGYVGCYRVLDSQYFGVAQRRRRVFVVGHLGTEPLPEVLALADGVSGHPPPSREAGARVGATLTRGAESRGRGGAAGRRREDDVNVVAAQCHGSNVGPMGTLRHGNGNVTGGVPFVAHTLRGEGHDGSEDGSGRGVPLVAHTLTGREGKGPDSDFTSGAVLAYRASSYSEGTYEEADTAGPLTTGTDKTRSAPIAFSVNQRLSEVHGALHEPSGTQLDGVLSFQERGRDDGRSLESQPDLSYALTSPGDGGRAGERNILAAIPRRLTPQECERLQGFPDGWTASGRGAGGEEIEQSDSARYRQLGNAVTVPVAEWIGARILEAHRVASPPAATPSADLPEVAG